MKNLAGIRAKIEVEGPPNPRSKRNSEGSTFRDINTLSTLNRFQDEIELALSYTAGVRC